LAPLSGALGEITEQIVNHAHQNNVKVAFNPGNAQLEFKKKRMDKILGKVQVLILNQEEASQLTKTSYQNEQAIFKKINQRCPGIAIMTKCDRGVIVSDGTHLYSAQPLPADIEDKTGAGDSFGSGFVSGLLTTQDLEHAIQLGVANASACLTEKGAKNGLLKKKDFTRVEVEKIAL